MNRDAAAELLGVVRAQTPVLELRNIAAGYGRTTVLRDVNIAVGAGAVEALLGPNGAGKTTLLRTAAGLLRLTAGSVWVSGADLTREPPNRRAASGVCLIPEGRGVFPNLTVKENLMLQAAKSPAGEDLDRVFEAFPVLRDRRRQLAGTMSGGQQQILAVARCYLAFPSIVLLDEVSMGLAPQVVDQIFDSLMSLVTEGISILLVEQYVNRALEMATTVHLLNRGELVFTGPARDLDKETVLSGYLGADVPGKSNR